MAASVDAPVSTLAHIGRVGAPLPKEDLEAGVAWRHVDLLLVPAVTCISAIGALMVYAATRQRLSTSVTDRAFLDRQLVFIVIGGGLLAFTTLFDYRRLVALWPAAYGLSVFSLLAAMSPLGAARKGAQRGFALPGGFQLQPSEFAKLAVILAVTGFCAHERSRGSPVQLGPRRLLQLPRPRRRAPAPGPRATRPGHLPGVRSHHHRRAHRQRPEGPLPAAPRPAGGHMRLRSGPRRAAEAVPEGPSHRLPRPESRRTAGGIRFNLNQSEIAIGSGGLTGKGLFKGTQTRLRYVPEQHTDFIFTVVGEELGLAGAVLLLALYGLAMWRIWRASVLANDTVGSLLCIGVLAMLCFQMFENVGMTMGIMPVTGIPLPFVSYGGSSMLMCCIGTGLVLNVHMRRYR